MFLLLLAAILAIIVLLRQCKPQITDELVDVVVANENIEPYSLISANQVTTGTKMLMSQAKDYFSDPQQVVGLMATAMLQKGQRIRFENALPPEKVRFVADMKYEVVSFPAVFSEMVGGQVRPGHKVNIYGYHRGTGQDHQGDMILVASNVWVVDVRTAAGEESRPTPEKTGTDSAAAAGMFSVASVGLGMQPASVVTVAAEPEVVQRIIGELGGNDYTAWVTLAPDPTHIATPRSPTSTPNAAPTAVPTATPIPNQAGGATGPTPSIVSGRLYMSDRDGGPQYNVYPNNTSVVWAVLDLQYSAPVGPIPIRIDVRQNGNTVFAGDFTHPKSGQASYLLNPTGGFAPDAQFTTTAYAGGRAFSVTWKTCGNTQLPTTGDDVSASGGN